MNNFIRLLGFASLLFALWVTGVWLFDPQLPVVPPDDDKLLAQYMPYVAFALQWFERKDLGDAILWVVFGLTAAIVLAATALAAWLAWRGGANRTALRDLIIGLALGAFSIGWFWFVRIWPPTFPAGAIPALDYPFMLAGCVGAWALLACLSGYPEPISRSNTFGRQQVLNTSARETALRQRRGEGLWRLWSWLPAERFGAYGRTTAPELRGVWRLLRSRELFWVVAFFGISWLAWRYAPGIGALPPGGMREAFSLCLGFLALRVLDPVLGARFVPVAQKPVLEETVANVESSIQRWVIGRGGLLAAIVAAIVFTALWHAGGLAAKVTDWVLLTVTAILAIHAINLLYMNWRFGNAEQRRAIGWIFLGTAGVAALGLAILILLSVLTLVYYIPGASKLGLSWYVACLVLVPQTTLLIFVLSLWASILHRGSFDPALALRKGASVAALGIVLTVLFVAVEGASSSLIVTHLGMPSASGSVIAGTVVALGFKPLRARVEHSVNQTMLRLLPPEAVADGERRVCAVLFCDLSGYTRLSETDEKEAMTLAAILHRHARVSASTHRGRVVKTIGDAVLCVFDDASQALAAAADLNRGYRSEAAKCELDALPLHSGLHVGEVAIARDGDVFGASVNLAARLQSLAGADELVASNSVADAIAVAAIPVEALPARRFKNIAEPVDCLRLRLV